MFPIPRNEGYETFIMEATPTQVAFVSLLEYKLHRENARPCLVLDFYNELLDTKVCLSSKKKPCLSWLLKDFFPCFPTENHPV